MPGGGERQASCAETPASLHLTNMVALPGPDGMNSW